MMLRIGQLLKHLTVLNPQSNPVRMALYNYLNHLHRAEQPLNADVINTFFCHALDYPHWQQDRMSFSKEMMTILEGMLQQISRDTSDDISMKTSSSKAAAGLGLDKILWPQDLQIIEIEHFHDFSEAIHLYLTQLYVHGEKFRLISDQQKKLLAVVLFPEGQVRVHSFDRKMTIRQGQLQPLRTDLSISYNSRLELEEAQYQKVDLGAYTCAQFELIEGEVVGAAVRGYLFQKHQDFRGGHLRDHLKIFYAVKRLEQSFIDRRTDTFYLELMESIERTSNLLKMGDPQAIQDAASVLTDAEAAFEQVFMGDKLLGLLIRDLQNLWQSKQNPQKFV